MAELFMELLKMSLIGALFALAVMVVRLVFRKAPKWIFVVLWGVVALRLLVPFSVESKASLVPDSLASGQIVTEIRDTYVGPVNPVPDTYTGPADSIYNEEFVYPEVLETVGQPIQSQQKEPVVTQPDPVEHPKTVGETVFPVLGWVWLAGVVLMTVYTAVSYLLLKRKMAVATLLRENIWQCEKADMPFVLGVFHPKVYLPYWIKGEDLTYVIAHEQAHIARRDHWWKPVGFLLLSVHWFNPVLWVAYILLCRDIEAACDEKVIGPMDKDHIRAYSTALLNCSVRRRRIAACPLAFGETGVKERIKRVMNYKKPAFWIIMIAILIAAVVVVCFCTNPLKKEQQPDPEPTESVATEQTPTENKDNTQKPIGPQMDYPKIDEIEYYFVNGTSGDQPVALMGYKNNSQYTVVSVQLYFSLKTTATQEELAAFDTFVNNGALTEKEISALNPCFTGYMVCDPGETVEGSLCVLFQQTYATDAKQCELLELRRANISFLGNDGRIYAVEYNPADDVHTLQKEAKSAKVWTTKSFTKVTPMPNTRFITVNRDNNDYYQFTAYDMTYEQYRAYCTQCQTAGFAKDVADNNLSFTCTDDRGLTLSIVYHPELHAVAVAATSDTEGKNDQLEHPVGAPNYTIEERISWYTPNLSGPVDQYLQVDNSRTVIYRELYYKYDTVIPIFLPILQPFSDDAVACQAEIEADLEEEFAEIAETAAAQMSRYIGAITFDATVHGDILSIIITCNGAWSDWYYTYNFDVTTGKRLSKEALAEKCGITNIPEALTRSAKAAYEGKWGHANADDHYIERLNATIDPENIAKAQLYLDQDGKLKAVMYIGSLAGAAGYDELIPVS